LAHLYFEGVFYNKKSTKETLEYLRKHGYSISERTLRRDKEIIREKNRIRLYQIAKIDFHQQHMQRIAKPAILKGNVERRRGLSRPI
jgi:hypothetical protein